MDVCIGMQVGIRYCCIKDIMIVDALQDDGSFHKTLTELQYRVHFRPNYELVSPLNSNGEEAAEYVKSKETSGIDG